MLVSAAPRDPHRAMRGFTLIELMVVVAMLAVVAAIATPSFRSFIGTIGTKAAAFDLISDLSFARSEAIKRNTNVTVQAQAGGWSEGWRVVAGTESLRERDRPGSNIAVTAPAGPVTFRPSGRIGDDAASASLQWKVESTTSGVTPRCILMTLTGSARSKVGACA